MHFDIIIVNLCNWQEIREANHARYAYMRMAHEYCVILILLIIAHAPGLHIYNYIYMRMLAPALARPRALLAGRPYHVYVGWI